MPTALVLGGYGLIGSACCRALSAAGFRVIGLGRSRRAAAAARDHEWIFRDLCTIEIAGWVEILAGVDVVVNAAGALQDGLRDDLNAVHATTVERLCQAARDDIRLVQISAAGAATAASTEFFRSKARGDAHVQASRCHWVILRPTLVLSSDAYGGTALLRGASALPVVLPEVMPHSLIETVHVDDVANAVVAAAEGRIPSGTIADLTEDQAHSLPDLMRAIRGWQGFSSPAVPLRVPNYLLTLAGRCADAAGRLGWRSPLRSTSLAVLREGIRGDPAAWNAMGGPACRRLKETLATLPMTRQERLYARLYFVLPLAIVVLSVFWMLSGVLALVQTSAAASTLEGGLLPAWAITGVVVGGAAADIALGVAILWRPWCSRAALGMALLSAVYLGGSVIAAPELWVDPLGPMLKVLPSIMLALIVWLGVEDR